MDWNFCWNKTPPDVLQRNCKAEGKGASGQFKERGKTNCVSFSEGHVLYLKVFPECLLGHNVAWRRYYPLCRLYFVEIPARRIKQSLLNPELQLHFRL